MYRVHPTGYPLPDWLQPRLPLSILTADRKRWMNIKPGYMNLHHWWLAIRPKTLPAAACPVVVGAACAVSDHRFSALMFAAALAGALLIQISVNLANDYFDFLHHIDTPDRKGPKRMTQSGLLPPETVRNA